MPTVGDREAVLRLLLTSMDIHVTGHEDMGSETLSEGRDGDGERE